MILVIGFSGLKFWTHLVENIELIGWKVISKSLIISQRLRFIQFLPPELFRALFQSIILFIIKSYHFRSFLFFAQTKSPKFCANVDSPGNKTDPVSVSFRS